jgi:hypothetical protein
MNLATQKLTLAISKLQTVNVTYIVTLLNALGFYG